jgi:PAS domain S-box-containing protein
MMASKFPIVAIGASSGGLTAIKAFFESMHVDSGAAFVVIQHLDPSQESLTAEILAPSTMMPTVQISEGMKIESNHIYVIPHNAYLTLNQNTFHLGEALPQRGLRLPIDAFLWSLAKQHEERAIAIIVSGNGSDGTLGLRAIKGSGGLVLAQSPETAEYDGMPRSAISTCLVDVVCPIKEMPKYLSCYLHYPHIIEHADDKKSTHRIENQTTVNNQYKNKVDELSRTNDDLANLLTSTEIATLFIDSELKIGRFTPAAQGLLNLIASDIGRPLSDIRPNFTDINLLKDVQKVLVKLSPIEDEINTEDGLCYIRRIVPYRTSEDLICGVVITFINITERKHAEEDNLRLATVIRDSNDAVTLLNPDGKITAWNNGAHKMYGWSEREALTMNIRELVPEDLRETPSQMMQSIQKGEDIHGVEAQRLTKDGAIIDVLLTVTPLFNKSGRVIFIATTERNISQRKETEGDIRASEANFRALVESAPDALLIVNTLGEIEVANSQAENLFGYSKDELTSMVVEKLLPKRFAAKHVIERQQYMKQPKIRVIGDSPELFALNKNGDEIPVEVSLSSIETNHGQVVSAAIRDIRKRQFADEALRAAKNQAESALATKSRFLATASHDIRQPLHSLILLNNALLKSIDQPKAQKMLSMQGQSLASMARLLNSLLDISKLESGKIEVLKRDFDLRPKLEQLYAEFEVESHDKGLQLTLDTLPKIFVNTDPGLLTQLLQNILSNAIRYTQRGFIKLKCSADKEYITIAVSDSGIGIPKERLGDIFDEFHQVNRDPQERHGGLGLGLSIVQRIAELLGTSIEVTSEMGQGSTFSIRLNRSESKPSVRIEYKTGTDQAIIKNAVILLIDDDLDVLDATDMLLSMEQGFEIITASSPPEAYEIINKLTPDLIISDFHLNHKDTGATIIYQAKTIDGHQLPAILVSGDTSSEMDKINTEKIVVMNKPVDPDKLIAMARQLLVKIP